jgi:multicomponent Na+:H+ antiporter subunit F
VSKVYLAACLAEMSVAVVVMIRFALGPTVSDRIVALNTISTQSTLAVLFFAAFAQRSIYLDVSLWLCSFSYLATVVWARYLERGLL